MYASYLSRFDCFHWQNTADEPGGDQDKVDRPADFTSSTTSQLLEQDQDEVSCDILTKSAQVEAVAVEAGGEQEGGQPVVGNRLTKSASWFNSLSRRASRKTPLKKRSFPGFRSQVQFVLGKNTVVSSST